MIAAGIGLRAGASWREIVDLLVQAATEARLSPAEIGCLATLDSRAGEAGFTTAATHLGLSAVAVSPETMRAVASGVSTRSPRVEALHGVGSVAEASALAAAGRDARLLLRRIASARATCALAQGDSP